MRALETFKQAVAEHVLVMLLVLALTALMTWPLAAPGPTLIPHSDDAYFSTWRLAWVAHQLAADPRHLFDANIFYPAHDTLAFSDAMVFLGVVAAPLFWLQVDPWRIHNAMLLLAFASSMYAMYFLAKSLTRDRWSAALGAVIFGLCPYRFAHIGHLELQWVVWMPLALLLLHRLFETPRVATALLLGGAVAAQVLCSIYYGVFLSMYLAAAWFAMAAVHRNRLRVLMVTFAAVLPLLAVAAIYGPPYARVREAAGPRAPSEIAEYSAQPADYLRVPPENRLRNSNVEGPASDERSLFPGAIAIVFAVAAFWPPLSAISALYGALALVALELSFGTNGWLFPVLQHAAPILTSLRSPARFGILVALSLSVLAAIGAARLRKAASPRTSAAVVMIAIVLAVGEYYSVPLPTRQLSLRTSVAHYFLKTLPPSTVVLELPVPRPDALWLYETTHQVQSMHHWRHLINGYSGFAPREYTRTLEALQSFPDDRSVARLRELGTDVIIVNRKFYEAAAYEALAESIRESPHFERFAVFDTGQEETIVVFLRK